MTLSLGEYAVGFIYFVVVTGGSISVAELIRRRRLSHLTGPPRVVATATVATVALVVAHLLPAVLGLLSKEAVAITVLVGLAAAALIPPVAGIATGRPPVSSLPDTALSRGIAIAAAAGLGAYVAAVAVNLGDSPPTNVDTLTFHLPGVARWIEESSIWGIAQFVPDQAHGYYPGTGNVVELAAILPWRSDFAIRLLGIPFLGVAAVAVYGSCRELRAPFSAALLAALMLVSLPAVTVYVVERPIPDIVTVAGFATGMFFLLRHNRTELGSDLVIAALGLGLAFGSKWYGVSATLVVILVWSLARLACHNRLAIVARQAALVLAVVLAVGGVWLVRNWVQSGNPLFPLTVSIGGLTVFDAPTDTVRDLFGHTIADYATDRGAWADFILPAYRDFLALPGALLALAPLGAVALALRERDGRGAILALAAAAAAAAVIYSVTPASALGPAGAPGGAGVNSRYLLPALILAAPLLAICLAKAGRFRHPLEALLVLAIADGVRQATGVSIGALAGCALLFAAGFGLWTLARRHPRSWRVVLAGVALAAIPTGYALERRYDDQRYAEDPVLGPLSAEYGADQRVGLAGSWELSRLQPPLPAFGPRLENEVEYVGTFEDGMLRPLGTRAEFTDALRDRDYDVLVVGNQALPAREALPVLTWARDAGYREIAGDSTLTLLVRG